MKQETLFAMYCGESNALPATVEEWLGRQLGGFQLYFPFRWSAISPEVVALARAGQIPLVCWATRDPTIAGGGASWADIAAGVYDEAITEAAEALAAVDAPLWVSFDSEMDGSQLTPRGRPWRGPFTDYAPAFRRLHHIVKPIAENVTFSFVVTGYRPNWENVLTCWDGGLSVRRIGFDVYQNAGEATALSMWEPFVAWARANLTDIGDKPIGVHETGTNSFDAAWVATIPEAAAALELDVVSYWNDKVPDDDYTLVPGSPSAVAWAQVGEQLG